jgi:hypothetical protein
VIYRVSPGFSGALLGWFIHGFDPSKPTRPFALAGTQFFQFVGARSAKKKLFRSTADGLDSTRRAMTGQCRSLVQKVWMDVEGEEKESN